MKMDGQAVELIKGATATLSKFYKDHPPALVQEDADPKADFNDANAHKTESGNIIAILDMMAEDFEKEMQEGQAEEDKAQAEYESQKADLEESLETYEATHAHLEEEKANLEGKRTNAEKANLEGKRTNA